MSLEVEVLPASADRWGDLVALFETSRVMTECWCMWPRMHRGTYQPGDPGHRDSLKDLVDSAEPPGLIAFVEGKPAGWCAVGRRSDYPQYGDASAAGDAWAIPCLFVKEDERGSGVAGALVNAAVAYATRRGAGVVHGPPPWWLPGDGRAIAVATEAFLENGFEKVGPGARMPLLERRVDV